MRRDVWFSLPDVLVNVQVYAVPKMLTLCHSATQSVAPLKDSDFVAMLKEHICASQTSEAGTYDSNGDLLLFCSRDPPHVTGASQLILTVRANREILLYSRRAVAVLVAGMFFTLHPQRQ